VNRLRRRPGSASFARALFLAVACAAIAWVGCGLDALGTLSEGVPDASLEASLPDSAPTDGAAREDASVDAGATLPSHVPPDTVHPDGAALSGLVAIDTTLQVLEFADGRDASAVPGVTFEVRDAGPSAEGGAAVLSVGAFTVDGALRVTGELPLVVVASGPVVIDGVISANARGTEPGPAGATENAGHGRGTRGNSVSFDDSGGGGAGHATAGATGADVGSVQGGAGGQAYALALVGGSGGGNGQVVACGNVGGAGGGAVQIFSTTSIAIGPGGGVNVSGGGGRGGCASGTSGGGGGSGGYLLLEAPSVRIEGIVAANGGGGGGGGLFVGGVAGEDGADGKLGDEPADGGGGANEDQRGGAGASAQMSTPIKPGPASLNGGGGGGAVGRILFRTRALPPGLDGGVVSPEAGTDTSL
jgi:hypothetical protein